MLYPLLYRVIAIFFGLVFFVSCSDKKEVDDFKKVKANFSCDALNKDQIIARYIQSEGGKDNRQLNLWRFGSKVMQEYLPPAISIYWAIDEKAGIWRTQYFDKHQRAIEYDAERLDQKQSLKRWQRYSQLLSDDDVAAMDKEGSYGQACKHVDYYTEVEGDKKYKLWWLSELKLPLRYEVKAEGNVDSTIWSLVQLDKDFNKIQQGLDKRENYHATDFADIGDNESDPFLLNMMNLGFIEHGASGFYNAEGHSMGDGHHH
ncbi:hypothetical protein [Agaribacterium sp. ZY112]|uniref:hypothetical protein n=1 Tax=Agaribacterium sp. ZY112 TaxID=3233574 RepID=UPI0035263763